MNQNDRRYEVCVGYPHGAAALHKLADALTQATIRCGHFASSFQWDPAKDERLVPDERLRGADLIVVIAGEPHVNALKKTTLRRLGPPVLILLVDGPSGVLSVDAHSDVGAPVTLRALNSRRGSVDVTLDYVGALLDQFRKPGFPSGWVRAHGDGGGGTARTNANPFLRRFDDQLRRWTVLNERCDVNASLKRAIADYFVDFYLERMSRGRLKRFFFESGSSIAYLSEVFCSRYDDFMKTWPDLSIETNNILSYFEFALFHQIRVALYPGGPPEKKYGATFGELPTRLKPMGPPERPRPLTANARSVVSDIARHFREAYAEFGIVFMASSGIELAADSEFAGPHVGSYYNQIFKRGILEAGVPTVIFVDETKLPRPFLPGSCFSVCDNELTWREVCQTKPIAIAAAFRDEQLGNQVRRQLADSGFCHVEAGRSGERPWTFVASNEPFKTRGL